MRAPLIAGLALLALLVSAATADSFTVQGTPSLRILDYGAGNAHDVENITLILDQTAPGCAWELLGSNDQQVFSRVDSRWSQDLQAGIPAQYNFTSPGAFRWYWLILHGGFPEGADLEWYLSHEDVVPPPGPQSGYGFVILMKRPPAATGFDFSSVPSGTSFTGYNLTSSVDLPGASWYLLGTNNPSWLWGDGTAVFTLVDEKTGIHLPAGTPVDFSVTGTFQYYVLYLRDGFATGQTLEVHFQWQAVTPTPTPVPGFSCSFVANVTSADEPPLAVGFLANTTNTSVIDSWEWHFGNGDISIDPWATSENYTDYGTYDVDLRIYNVSDMLTSWCNRSAYIRIGKAPPPGSLIPTVIPLTPSQGYPAAIPSWLAVADIPLSLGLVLGSAMVRREDSLFMCLMVCGFGILLAAAGATGVLAGAFGDVHEINLTSQRQTVSVYGPGGIVRQVQMQLSVAPAVLPFRDPTVVGILVLVALVGAAFVAYYFLELAVRKGRRLEEDDFG